MLFILAEYVFVERHGDVFYDFSECVLWLFVVLFQHVLC